MRHISLSEKIMILKSCARIMIGCIGIAFGTQIKFLKAVALKKKILRTYLNDLVVCLMGCN